MFSRPTAIRTKPSTMPASFLACGVMRQCVVVAGWVMVVRVSPKLAVIEHRRVLLMS